MFVQPAAQALNLKVAARCLSSGQSEKVRSAAGGCDRGTQRRLENFTAARCYKICHNAHTVSDSKLLNINDI